MLKLFVYNATAFDFTSKVYICVNLTWDPFRAVPNI